MEPQIETKNRKPEVGSAGLSENPDRDRIGTPEKQSMENYGAENAARYLDPDYPSREILLEAAEKLLQSFESTDRV